MSASPDVAVAVFHWLEDLGLLGAIGSMVVRRLGRNRPRIDWAQPRMEIALAGALAGGVGLLAVDRSLPWPIYVRVAAEAVALVTCLRGIPYVAPFTVLAAVTLPLTGHAAQVEPPAGAEFADALHVLSAGMWAGGIIALASLNPPGGWGGTDARLLLDRFSPVALIAFGVTALTGVLRATEQLAGLSDLWSTSYGVVLALKVLGVGAMLVLSTLAWRRRLPVERAEAAMAALVLAATAVLASLPIQA